MSDEGRGASPVNMNDGLDRPRCRCPLAKGGIEHYRTDRCPESGRKTTRPPWRCLLFGHQSSTGVLYRDSTSRCLRCGRSLPVSGWRP